MTTSLKSNPTMTSKRKIPSRQLPRVWCDFNSGGWSGEDEDHCYYAFDEKILREMKPRSGMRVFIYEPSRDGLVMGCEARLEVYQHPVSEQSRWRLRPVPDTAYLGHLE